MTFELLCLSMPLLLVGMVLLISWLMDDGIDISAIVRRAPKAKTAVERELRP